MFEIPEWPHSLGPPQTMGVIRQCPEDFIVEEIPRVQPEGEGSHLWLWVEKRSANTDWVARELAGASGCQQRDVGFAGLKDRHAVTRQWFSIPVTATTVAGIENAVIDGVRILDQRLHGRKLKRGTLKGNRFQLRIRDLGGESGQLNERLEVVRVKGVPNYFGPQRFGHEGRNVAQGFKLLSANARLKRNKKSIYLSAIRSFLFNQVLAERVRLGTWNSMMNGDLAMLDGTQSIFLGELPDPDIEDRCKRLDIHPTGPLPGDGGTQPLAEAAELELAVMRNWPDLQQLLLQQRVQASRRSLRLCPAGLEWVFAGGDLELTFELPAGAYATTVLREILNVAAADNSHDRNE